jgi:hypothetical protein
MDGNNSQIFSFWGQEDVMEMMDGKNETGDI